MTQSLSTTLANTLANAVADTFADGELELYSGTPGATPEDTGSGVLLASLKLPIAPFATASGGAVALAGQWFGTVGTGGVVAWARFVDATDAIFLVVTVTTSGGGGNIIIDNATLALHAVVQITAFTYTIPTGA